MEKEPRKTVHLVLPKDHYDQLKELAKENCYSLPGYIRRILKVHLQTTEEK